VITPDGLIVGAKAPTTPNDRSVGFFDSIERAAGKIGVSIEELLGSCDRLVHGTTTGTNAIVSRDGARTGLITTAGQGDIMFLMRGGGRTAGLSPDEALHVPSTDKPDPLVPKHLIAEVPERVDVDGDVIVALDEEAVKVAVRRLVEEEGAQSLAVSLIWSVKNPSHERRIREIISEITPDVFVSCASDLVSQVGEYERTTTAVMNAYIGPLMVQYIESIESGAAANGFAGQVLFAQCAGGAITGEEARRAPIRTVQSGPVAGIVSSELLASRIGIENLLLADMGGTTFDVSVVHHGQPLRRNTSIFERYELALPMLDVESIGAGGGSIAWIDGSERLNVGPKSAGAMPGPACYGNGGTEATVTDADIVLGVLDPKTFLNGRMQLQPSLSADSIQALADRLGLGLYETAAGINRIVDSKMADLIRRMSVLRGLDPRKFALFAFGGGGPVHATAVAREAGIKKVVVPLPYVAALWSALGAAVSDVSHIYQEPKSFRFPVSAGPINDIFERLETLAHDTLADEGLLELSPRVSRSVRMKYAMQVHDVEVPVGAGALNDPDMDTIDADFGIKYEALYGEGSGYREGGIEITGFQVRVDCVTEKPPFAHRSASEDGGVTRDVRPVYWSELGELVDTPVLRLDRSTFNDSTPGPALIELPDTVVVVRPRQTAQFDDIGNLIIDTGV
jgi:N-methylhydantoinase A